MPLISLSFSDVSAKNNIVIVILSVFIISVAMLFFTMLSGIIMSVLMLNLLMRLVIMLSDLMPSAVILNILKR